MPHRRPGARCPAPHAPTVPVSSSRSLPALASAMRSLLAPSHVRRFGAALTITTAAACSGDRAMAPAGGATSPLLSPAVVLAVPLSVDGVQWNAPLARNLVVSAVIDHKGGTLAIPQTGFKLTVPRNAVSGPTEFSVTAVAGSIVAYEFEPHGTQFPIPLVASQDIRFTRLTTLPPVVGSSVRAAYFPDASQLDQATGRATVSEYAASLLDVAGFSVRFNINHFSGYMVSSGRSDDR